MQDDLFSHVLSASTAPAKIEPSKLAESEEDYVNDYADFFRRINVVGYDSGISDDCGNNVYNWRRLPLTSQLEIEVSDATENYWNQKEDYAFFFDRGVIEYDSGLFDTSGNHISLPLGSFELDLRERQFIIGYTSLEERKENLTRELREVESAMGRKNFEHIEIIEPDPSEYFPPSE